MARFKVGDQVKILPAGTTPFTGLAGTIVEILADQRNIAALDRYVVIFQWGEKQVFYDVQLSGTQLSSSG